MVVFNFIQIIYEDPKDSDNNNSYVVTLRATDNANLFSEQTVTVTDVGDTCPIITGPSGGAGASTSIISILENTTSVQFIDENKFNIQNIEINKKIYKKGLIINKSLFTKFIEFLEGDCCLTDN